MSAYATAIGELKDIDTLRSEVLRQHDRATAAEVRVKALMEALRNPTKHTYWGAGEPDCPKELKAGNGELHTLRCKVCGSEDLRSPICLAAIKEMNELEVQHDKRGE